MTKLPHAQINIVQKIWREIGRPFKQGLRVLYKPYQRLVSEIASLRSDVSLLRSEIASVNKIVPIPKFDEREFIERLFECKRPSTWHDHKIWGEFVSLTRSDELDLLTSRLVAGTDKLSHEVVARYIARRRFIAQYGDGKDDLWKIASQLFGLIYPLDLTEQKRLRALGESYHCPYKFPHGYGKIHMAIGFGLNQFPSEIQEKVAGKDIIDGGGYSGDSAMILSEYGARKVYTFEPNPEVLPIMEKVFAENSMILGSRLDRIEVVPMALGGSKGTVAFRSSGAFDLGANVIKCNDGRSDVQTHSVNMISIDEFVATKSLDVGLIKLDVEGVEFDTILNSKETIIKQKPLLIISIYHRFRDFFEIKPLIESWNLGYKFEIRHHNPPDTNCEFVLMAY